MGFPYPDSSCVGHCTSSICQWNFPFSHNSAFNSLSLLPPPPMQQVISVWVRDPRIRKNDFWHAYMDYEICLHVSKMRKGICFDFYNQMVKLAVIFMCPVLDHQRVLHQEGLKCEKEVQRVCMAQAEATSKLNANVSRFTVFWTHTFMLKMYLHCGSCFFFF